MKPKVAFVSRLPETEHSDGCILFAKVFAFAQCAIMKYDLKMSGPTMLNPAALTVAANKRRFWLCRRCLPAVRTHRVAMCVLYKAKVQP